MKQTIKSLIINLIYVKGSVDKLLPLVSTHLEHSNCRYRLISNGCLPTEENLLKNFVEKKTQLLFYSLNTEQVLPHHAVLNHLLELDKEEYFAFMDTDILAISDPLPMFLEKMKKHDGFTSGFPVWHDDADLVMRREFMVMGGRFAKVHTGDVVGLSYLGIYHRDRLKSFIELSGIDFNRYKWKDIPVHYQIQLRKWGLKKSYYDTGKLLVLLWNKHDGNVTYGPTEELIHFGGISGGQHLTIQSKTLRKRLVGILPKWAKYYSRYLLFIARLGVISIDEYDDLLKLIAKRNEVFLLLNHFQTGATTALSNYSFEMLSKEKIKDLSKVLKSIYC